MKTRTEDRLAWRARQKTLQELETCPEQRLVLPPVTSRNGKPPSKRVNEPAKFKLNRGTMPRPSGPARAYICTLIVGLTLTTPAAYAQGKWVMPALSSEPAEEVPAREGDPVLPIRRLPRLTLPIASSVSPPRGREGRTVRPWWIGFELEDGQIKLSSDKFSETRNPAFALGFVGGHSLGNQARIGLELNGWLLQSFNNNNPAVGESVSNVLGWSMRSRSGRHPYSFGPEQD
jgi:hypothetical protein